VGSGKKGKFALQDHFYPQDFKTSPKARMVPAEYSVMDILES
jgi:hypothetical protein